MSIFWENELFNVKIVKKSDYFFKIFDKIFSPNNTDHQKVECFTNDNSILKTYHEIQSFDLAIFANELLKAEKKKDSTRNQQITQGFLFYDLSN